MKRTYQPSNIRRKRTHGFLERMSTKSGRNVLKRRRAKGRKRLTVWPSESQGRFSDGSGPCFLPLACQKARQTGTPTITMKGAFGFSKKERITHSQDFRKTMKFGKRLNSKSFILFLQKNESGFHRLGIVVKKEVGPATYRNRIKRYIREFFRLHKHQIKGSFDIVLLVKKETSINRYVDAEKELRRCIVSWKQFAG